MKSISFPNIFNGSSVNMNENYYAIKVNLKSLLMSNKGGLFGDPNYGVNIKKILWNQANTPLELTPVKKSDIHKLDNTVARELLKDEIFNAIYSYLPQIEIDRKDVTVTIDGNLVMAEINVKVDSSIPSDLFKISILLEDEN